MPLTEQRKAQRVKSYYQLKYGTASGDAWSAPALTTTKNLSANGVLFRTQESLPLGAMVRLQMHLLPMNQVLTILAKVARAQRTRWGWDVACQFLEITPDAQAAIERFARRVNETPRSETEPVNSFQALWRQFVGA